MERTLQITLGLVSLGLFVSLFRRAFFIGRPALNENWFGPLDVSLALLISALFALLAIDSLTAPPIPFSENDIGKSILAQLIFGGAIIGYLLLRKIPLRDFFGLGERPFWKLLGLGMILILGIYPLVSVVSALLTAQQSDEQETIKFFRDHATMQGRLLLGFMAVIIAPAVEEIVFRGMLYRTFKGYFGRIAAMFFTSVLFASIHGNVASLVPLTLLAFGLTIGLELSGSLIVSIAMHGTFNALSLILLLAESQK